MRGRLLDLLASRADEGRPLRVGLAGAGAFGTMLLTQAGRLRGLEVAAVADLDADRARVSLRQAGIADARVCESGEGVLETGVDVLVEATGSPHTGCVHALAAIERGVHVVMATVEADALAGPVIADRAREAGVVYSLAYGDQPALVCELVDWARACGFEVVCAGKGTKHLPAYHSVTPDEVWEHYGLSPEQVAAGGFDAGMFTSFLDGTKSAIEMAAVCNATGLEPQPEGLGFPPCAARDLARACVPAEAGGVLSRSATVEVVSSLERDGTPLPDDLRWGVFVTFDPCSASASRRLADYGVQTDPSGRYGALYRPYHLIGLETTVSILSVGLLGEPTGSPTGFRADAVATAKRDLAAGETLDGEGGTTVYGRLFPAAESVAAGFLPIGLSRGIRLARAIGAGEPVRRADVEAAPATRATALRRELESLSA
jgi:predicted homoserine dehydrogenase-like protein